MILCILPSSAAAKGLPIFGDLAPRFCDVQSTGLKPQGSSPPPICSFFSAHSFVVGEGELERANAWQRIYREDAPRLGLTGPIYRTAQGRNILNFPGAITGIRKACLMSCSRRDYLGGKHETLLHENKQAMDRSYIVPDKE